MTELYVVLGIFGVICIIAAIVGGGEYKGGPVAVFLHEKLSRTERWCLGFFGALILVAAVVLPSVKFHFGGGSMAKATIRTPVYLSDLKPQGGDKPMRGDTQIGNQDFPNSIFYDNVPGNQSQATACQNSSDPTCQATDYSIANARYRHFSAMLGVTGCDGDTAHWSLTVDGYSVKSGEVAVNGSPQAVSVAIPAGNSLELLVSTSSFSGAACGGVDIIWGNAKLS